MSFFNCRRRFPNSTFIWFPVTKLIKIRSRIIRGGRDRIRKEGLTVYVSGCLDFIVVCCVVIIITHFYTRMKRCWKSNNNYRKLCVSLFLNFLIIRIKISVIELIHNLSSIYFPLQFAYVIVLLKIVILGSTGVSCVTKNRNFSFHHTVIKSKDRPPPNSTEDTEKVHQDQRQDKFQLLIYSIVCCIR